MFQFDSIKNNQDNIKNLCEGEREQSIETWTSQRKPPTKTTRGLERGSKEAERGKNQREVTFNLPPDHQEYHQREVSEKSRREDSEKSADSIGSNFYEDAEVYK